MGRAIRRPLLSAGGPGPGRMSNRIKPRPAIPERRPTSPTLRWQVAFPAILAVVAALLGAVAGGLITANAGEDIKTREIQEQRADAARKVRGEAYLGFLETADNVDQARAQLWTCYRNAVADEPVRNQCGEQETPADAAVADLIKKQDALLIYGSSGSVQIAQEIIKGSAVFIEDIATWRSDVYQYLTDEYLKYVTAELPTPYGRLRVAFQKQMCRDLNPLPRSDC